MSVLHGCGRAVAFVPHSPLLAVAAHRGLSDPNDGQTVLYDWQTRALPQFGRLLPTYVRKLMPAPEKVRTLSGTDGALAVSADGKMLATARSPGRIDLWDPVGDRKLGTLTNAEPVHALAFSPDGRWLAACSAQSSHVWLWEVPARRQRGAFAGHSGRAWAVAFSPDSQRLVTGGADQTVRVWQVANRAEQRRFTGHLATVRAVAFSRDGRQILSAGEDATIRLWRLDAPTLPRTYPRAYPPFVFSPDGQRLAGRAASGGAVVVWELATGRTNHLSAGGAGRQPAFFAPDSRSLALLDFVGTNQSSRIAWVDLATKGIGAERLFSGRVGEPSKFLFIGNLRSRMSNSDPRQTKKRSNWQVAPDGKLALDGYDDGLVSVWNPVSGALLRDIMTVNGGMAEFRFSPDQRQFLIVDEHGKVSLWETDTGRSMVVLPTARREKVAAIVFSPDGQLLASGGIGNAVSLWEVATGRLLLALPGHQALRQPHRLLA